MENTDLERFIEAQDHPTIYGLSAYDQAHKEIANGGLKIHCWIRYLYLFVPQIPNITDY